jgi:hypothetical protein
LSRMIIRSILALSAVLMLGLMLAAPMASATATAEAPAWNEGDAWAVGKTMDLDAEFAQELQDLEEMLEQSTNPANLEVNQFDIQAMASAYALFKVDMVNDTEVHLKGSFAAKFTGDASVSITADMEKPGIWDWDDDILTESRTASADVELAMAMVLEVEAVLEKETAAVKSITLSIKASLSGSAVLVNIPREESNWTTRSIFYENYDVSADLNVFMTLEIQFQPSLNIYDFPLTVGDEWVIESTAVMSGTYGGTVDITGLPEDMEDELFASEMLQEAGIDSFPIDLAQVIQNSDEPAINNGVIGPESVVIGPATLNCVSVEQITLPEHGVVSKYTIKTEADTEFYYIDGVDLLTGMQEVADEMGLIDEIPVDLPVDSEMLTMDSVSAEDAEQGIQDIADYRAQISGESTSDGSGLDSDMMMLLLIIAVVAVVGVVAVVILMKRKPKAP